MCMYMVLAFRKILKKYVELGLIYISNKKIMPQNNWGQK